MHRALTEAEVRGAATAFTFATQAAGIKLNVWAFKKPKKQELLDLSRQLAWLLQELEDLANGPPSGGHSLDLWALHFIKLIKTAETELESLVEPAE